MLFIEYIIIISLLREHFHYVPKNISLCNVINFSFPLYLLNFPYTYHIMSVMLIFDNLLRKIYVKILTTISYER